MTEEVGDITTLDELCGHHCGVHMTGNVRRVAHCPCPECHGLDKCK